MKRYKITNRTFSPMLLSIGIIPARGSITIVGEISKELRAMERKSKISIKEIKEK